MQIIQDIHFQSESFEGQTVLAHSYDRCVFDHTDFTESHFKECSFFNTTFKHCNWSNARVTKTSFTDCTFENCKMIGIQFDLCENYFYSWTCKHCLFDYSSLFKLKLAKSNFIECRFRDTDFTQSDLSACTFIHCDFTGAHFEKVNLEKADFLTSRNFLIDPSNNKVKKLKVSKDQLEGFLYKYGLDVE